MSLLESVTSKDVIVTPEELALLFKALAHPWRLAMLQLLKDNELCVCEIEEALGLRQAYVSQQLTVLREAGLVCYRKEGWNVHYRIARAEVYTLMEMATVILSELGTCAVTSPDEVQEQNCGTCPPAQAVDNL